MHEIEQLMKDGTQEQFDLNLNDEQRGRKVVILDGMAVVNRIIKRPETKNMQGFGDAIHSNRVK